MYIMYYDYEVRSFVGLVSFFKEQLVDLGTRPFRVREIAFVSHGHFLDGGIEKWHSSYSP